MDLSESRSWHHSTFLTVFVILHDLVIFWIIVISWEFASSGMRKEVLLFLLFLIVGDYISRLRWAHFQIAFLKHIFILFLDLSFENVGFMLDVFLTQTVLANDLLQYVLQIFNPRQEDKINLQRLFLSIITFGCKNLQLILIFRKHALE